MPSVFPSPPTRKSSISNPGSALTASPQTSLSADALSVPASPWPSNPAPASRSRAKAKASKPSPWSASLNPESAWASNSSTLNRGPTPSSPAGWHNSAGSGDSWDRVRIADTEGEDSLFRCQRLVKQLPHRPMCLQNRVPMVHRSGQIRISESDSSKRRGSQHFTRRRLSVLPKEKARLRIEISVAPAIQYNSRDVALRIKSRPRKHIGKLLPDSPLVLSECS